MLERAGDTPLSLRLSHVFNITAEDVVRSSSDKSESKQGQQHIFQSLQYLRKLCNHPALVLKDDKRAARDVLEKTGHKDEAPELSDIHHAPKLLALRFVCIYMS